MSEEIYGAFIGYGAGVIISSLVDAAFGEPEDHHGSATELFLNLGLEIGLLGALAFPVLEVLSELVAESDATQASANIFFVVGMQPGLDHLSGHVRQLRAMLNNWFWNGMKTAISDREKVAQQTIKINPDKLNNAKMK
jgi:hypothetical protein